MRVDKKQIDEKDQESWIPKMETSHDLFVPIYGGGRKKRELIDIEEQ